MHALLKLAVLILAGSNALAADALHLGGVQGGHAQVVFAAAPNDEQLLAHQPVRFDQHRLVRFHEVSRAMAALRRMEEETGETVDIWGYVVDEKKRRGNSAQMTMTTAVDVRLSTEQLQRLVEWTSVPRAMNGSGIVSRVPTLRYTIVEQNVQAAIDEESVRLRRSKNDGLLQDKKKTWFEEYHRFDEIVEWYVVFNSAAFAHVHCGRYCHQTGTRTWRPHTPTSSPLSIPSARRTRVVICLP